MKIRAAFPAALLALSGCILPPISPSVKVFPAQGKSSERFAQEDASCKEFALHEISGYPYHADSDVVGGAISGTLLGPGVEVSVNAGQTATKVMVMLIGTGIYERGDAWMQMTLQQRDNVAYMQCMHAKGNDVPGYTGVAIASPPQPPPRSP